MAERRCPTCGALVVEDARWCGQCYAPLPEPPQAAAPIPTEVERHVDAPTAVEPSADAGSEASARPSPEAPETTVRQAAKTATWPCPTCDHRNPIELDVCEVCGTPFARLFRDQVRPPEVAPRSAALWSLLFPGLGHWRCGRSLDGVARAVIFVWTLGTLLILVASRAGKGGFGATAPLFALFLVATLVVWITAAYDAYRIAAGEEPTISSRTLLWGSVILIVLSVLLASLVTLPAARG